MSEENRKEKGDGKGFREKLHSKRARTEEKIRKLEQQGKEGVRYTATISDIPFLVVGLICDIGWLIHIITAILYFKKYRFHVGNSILCFLDILAFMALLLVVFGVIMIIYLGKIHEKEIATRLQKNLSFGATIFGGLAAGIIGAFQLNMVGGFAVLESQLLIWMTFGGFLNFVFGLPIFASFKRGIIYSDKID